MKESIIKFRAFLLRHIKNKTLQTLIWGLISHEMISYMLFGLGTCIVDYVVFSSLTKAGLFSIISNIISTVCAIIFAYTTNKLWVFKSKTSGFFEVLQEFMRFANARIATLLMTTAILAVAEAIDANEYYAKLIAMILTIIFNYILSKLFIFNKRKGTGNVHKKTK